MLQTSFQHIVYMVHLFFAVRARRCICPNDIERTYCQFVDGASLLITHPRENAELRYRRVAQTAL